MKAWFMALWLLLIPAGSNAEIPDAAWFYRADMLRSAWRTFGLSAPTATLAAQIHQESAWKPDVVSWAGAGGLAQFMPGTAEDMATRFPQLCAPANPFSPKWAFRCRDLYLKSLINASENENTSECSHFVFGLRAYNGGLGWIRKDRRLAEQNGANPDEWQEVQPFNSGRRASAYKENTEYPIKIFKREPEYEEWGWGRGLNCL